MNKLKVLILEPYWGGSHKAFLNNIMRLDMDFTLMTLPPRKWKWRMRLSAMHFIELLNNSGQKFDRVLCSTFVDVATLRGLGPRWLRDVPVLTYFHENQFEYPVRKKSDKDLHFGITNMTTALASDSLAFNSQFNLDSFLDGVASVNPFAHDMSLGTPVEDIRNKSVLIPPAIDFSFIDDVKEDVADEDDDKLNAPIILWNHRWEHDKNPEEFFSAIMELASEGVEFRLAVLGQVFDNSPKIFHEARETLGERVIQFGFADSLDDYAGWLRRAHIVVSTSIHEFFGISVVEAVRGGARPLLPNRLSYPNLFGGKFLYQDGELKHELRALLIDAKRLDMDEARALTNAYSWEHCASAFDKWLRE